MNYYKIIKNLNNLSFEESDEQVDLILDLLKNKTSFSFVRFNDGEMMGIDKIGSVAARGDQKIDEILHNKLIQCIKHTQKNYYIGIPCSNCYPHYFNLAKTLINQPEKYLLNAVAMANRNWGKFIVEFPKIIKNTKIVWISGDDQKLDFIKNEMGLNIIKHIKHPSKNTWACYNKIKCDYLKYMENNLDFNIVMVSSGPTARVFCKEMFEYDRIRTYIDVGSTFDPFTRNVWHNCHKGWLDTGFNKVKRCNICN